MTVHKFAKAWDYKLNIKSIFMGESIPDLPTAAQTIDMAKEVAERVKALCKRIENVDPDLWVDLDNCVDELEELDGIENAYEARDRFNEVLGHLYDQADYGKRVWID